MDSQIVDLIFTFTVNDQARYEEALAQQLAITQTEPHVLSYEVFRRPDNSYCQHERYANEAAIVLHVQNTAAPLAGWSAVTNITSMLALGPLSEAYKQQYDLHNYLPYQAVTR